MIVLCEKVLLFFDSEYLSCSVYRCQCAVVIFHLGCAAPKRTGFEPATGYDKLATFVDISPSSVLVHHAGKSLSETSGFKPLTCQNWLAFNNNSSTTDSVATIVSCCEYCSCIVVECICGVAKRNRCIGESPQSSLVFPRKSESVLFTGVKEL